MAMLGISNSAITEENRATNGAGKFISDFKTLEGDYNNLSKGGVIGLSLLEIFAIATEMARFSSVLGKEMLSTLSKFLGIFGILGSATDVASTFVSYKNDIGTL